MQRSIIRTFTAVVTAVCALALITVPLASAEPNSPPMPPGGGPMLDPAPAPPIFPNVRVQRDVGIRMSDGVTLKGDVYSPADVNGNVVDRPLPTVVAMTPYLKLTTAIYDAVWNGTPIGDAVAKVARSIDLTGTPFSGITDWTQVLGSGFLSVHTGVNRALIARGFNMMVVDIRGQGESEGALGFFDAREQQDSLEVLDWIRQQPWSNGKLGMAGASYLGIAAVLTAAKAPEGLDAIFPVVPSIDPYGDLVSPGGEIGLFPPLWYAEQQATKFLPPFESILNGTANWDWLKSRLDLSNFFPYLVPGLEWIFGGTGPIATSDEFKLRQADPSKIKAATMVVGGWPDMFRKSEPEMYRRMTLPPGEKQLVMGDWFHGQQGRAGRDVQGPGTPPNLSALEVAWFDHWLNGVDNGIDKQGPVTLAQQGGTWTVTTDFPRPGSTYRRLYLSGDATGTAPHSVHDGSLHTGPVTAPGQVTVSPGVASLCSKDMDIQTLAFFPGALFPGCDLNAAAQELNALSFTSEPVDQAVQISGPLNLHLITSTPAHDARWAVTLNDVAPDGTSRVLANGSILSSFRGVNESTSLKLPNGDYTQVDHPLDRDSQRLVVPGEATPIDVMINPTDAVLQPGHRLRVNVLAGSFPGNIPNLRTAIDTQLAPQTIHLDPTRPSFLTFPVVGDVPFGITPPQR